MCHFSCVDGRMAVVRPGFSLLSLCVAHRAIFFFFSRRSLVRMYVCWFVRLFVCPCIHSIH